MNEQRRRDAVRHAYGQRCGYWGVQEEDIGSELEIDHFQPRTAGGQDVHDNLVYCCPACNRIKGDFWPIGDPWAATQRLLHPQRDDLAHHLREGDNGTLTALTDTGALHIERLRLNRAPLVALRQRRQDAARLRQEMAEIHRENRDLLHRIALLEDHLEEILARLARLSEP